MYNITIEAAAGDKSSSLKHKYVKPEVSVVEILEGCAILAESGSESDTNGWTTTTPSGGSPIIEEDKDNPYDDNDF